MNTTSLARATAWLSERLPGTHLSDFAAMLELGVAAEPVRLMKLAEKLGMPLDWADGFTERQVRYQGGLAPLVELTAEDDDSGARLSQIGHNILNQFWQRASSDAVDKH